MKNARDPLGRRLRGPRRPGVEPSPPIRARLSHPVPTKRLVDFQRVRLAAGAVTNVTFTVPAKRLSITNEKGGYVLYAGVHMISFATGALRN